MKSLFSDPELEGLAPEEQTFKHRSGSVYSSAALISGTTIGAGILALPAVTLPVGVLPSTAVMLGAWLYMVVSGLLIAEANLQAMRQTGRTDLGLLATIQDSLGKGGAAVAGVAYIFIHYALLVAYVARGGDILATGLARVSRAVGWLPSVSPSVLLSGSLSVPLWWGHVAFAVLLGSFLYVSSERWIGWINSALVVIAIAAFASLLLLVAGQADIANLEPQHWENASAVIPVMFVAFVYQNVVPVVARQLNGDDQKVRQSIWIGAAVPLVMFALWNAVILAAIPLSVQSLYLNEGASGVLLDPVELLRVGATDVRLGAAISIFSELAIATSFIGFVFGLLSVFQDIFASTTIGRSEKPISYLLVFLPPLLFSFLDPNLFFAAIDYAGAFGNSVLFGIIPALMVWKLRDSSSPLVPGGKGLLIGMIVIAVSVIVQNVWLKLSAFS
ncbi:MAG: amino acid permease [Phormidesmis sp.]